MADADAYKLACPREDLAYPPRCCYIPDGGEQCPAPAIVYVVGNAPDDYTVVCGDHVESMRRDGDRIHRIVKVETHG